MSAAGSSEKVFEYLDKRTDPDLNATYKTDQVHGEIEFKNVSFAYPNRNETTVLNVKRVIFIALYYQVRS